MITSKLSNFAVLYVFQRIFKKMLDDVNLQQKILGPKTKQNVTEKVLLKRITCVKKWVKSDGEVKICNKRVKMSKKWRNGKLTNYGEKWWKSDGIISAYL